LTAGDRVKAQEELKISIEILSTLPDVAAPDSLRLQLVEETALLKAALSDAPSAQEQEVDNTMDEQDEEEDEADTEAAPDLIVSGEEPTLAPRDSAVIPIPEVHLSDFDVPIVLNEQVRAYILYYQTRKWGVLSRAFERSGRYLPMMRRIFRDQGLPQDLVNLAYVESAFNYRAYSPAKASGLWQFIKATGNRYGMKVNYWLDERRDPEKATKGAAAYLKDLYEMFHSWPLALAAYNAGEQRVQRAIETQGTTDFWSLRLPQETERFVPAFMAATIIAKDPGRYGFTAPVEESWDVERATVPGAIELRSVARVVGVSSDLIRDLNPALMRGVTPVHASEHEILLPPGTKEILLAGIDQLPRYSHREPIRTATRRHRVGKGDTLESIASRHQTPVVRLASLNGLKVGDRLKAGAVLRLPVATRGNEMALSSARGVGAKERAEVRKAGSSPRSAAYVVKRGDTLWKIARTYGVRPEDLRQWNDLTPKAKLKPGLALRVVAQAATSNREVGRTTIRASATPPVVYRVRRGDTLWGIAKVHDVTPSDIRRWNDLGHKPTLVVGQELRIRTSES
jgi:membrane-bound lytic murein transglycosylase D